MPKPPDKPCKSCEHAPCQLPLNCHHWLRYQQERRQYWEDTAALRQAKLSKRYEPDTASGLEWQRRLAEACPWVRKEEGE